MHFRFRRSVQIAPGFRLNFGKRSISTSFGPRGAQVTTGTHGTRTTAGIPGSGLSVTEQQKAPRSRTAKAATATTALMSGLATVLWVLFASLIAAVFRNRR